MKFPVVDTIQTKQEMTTVFSGYDHTLSCIEGYFYDMKNMSSDHYPVMSPRVGRHIESGITFTNFQGMIYADQLCWVDDGFLYINNVKKTGFTLTNSGMKTIVKMGAYLVFFPDKKWYNTNDDTYGNMEASADIPWAFYHTAYIPDEGTIYPKTTIPNPPTDGMYTMKTVGGKKEIYQYSANTDTWNAVTDVYTTITPYSAYATDYSAFKKGDGVKITLDDDYLSSYEERNIYINDEGDGKRSASFALAWNGGAGIVIPVTTHIVIAFTL